MTALLITQSRTFEGLSHKDKDKDKDQIHKDKDLKLVLKESLTTRTRIDITGFNTSNCSFIFQQCCRKWPAIKCGSADVDTCKMWINYADFSLRIQG